MAAQKKKASASKKRPSVQKKNTGKSTGKSTGKRKQEKQMPDFFGKEVLLLLTLGISLFLFLADLGIGTEWIKKIGQNMWGFFGYLNILFPFGLFLGVALILANPESVRAKLKVVAGCLIFVDGAILSALLIPGDDGALGFFFGSLMVAGLGLPITVVLLLLVLILNIVLITERSFFQAVGNGSRKVYDTARNDAIKRREQTVERQEMRISKSRQVRDVDGKAYGVPLDIRLTEEKRPKRNLHEITIESDILPEENLKVSSGSPVTVVQNTKKEPVNFFAHDSQASEPTLSLVPEPETPVRKRRKKTKAAPQNVAEETQAVEEEIQQGIEADAKKTDTASGYQYPPISLLKKGTASNNVNSNRAMTDLARRLEQTLLSFGVKVTVNNVTCGPSVTRFELLPEQGTKVSKITSLEDDIKMNLAATTIRIEAPIPGKAAIGIEIPNEKTSPVLLRDLIESRELSSHPSKIAFGAGKDISGKVIVGDIGKFPHMLVAGTTGSGKSVYTNSIIMSILYRATPEEVRLIIVDPKVVEFQVYDGIPHLLIPVVTDPKKAAGALSWAVGEMNSRYNKFAELRVRDLKDYNEKITTIKYPEGQEPPKPLPQIVIIIDELADLMMVAKNEVESSIVRIAQLARAAGIYMIIATQRPSVDVVTGLIKANMPSRTSLRVSSGTDSRVIIDQVGAEKLLGNGDMLFYPAGFKYPERVQGAYVSTEEVERTVEFLKSKNNEVVYNKEIEESMNAAASSGGADTGSNGVSDELDGYFADAGRYIIEKNKASIGNLQRVFKIGFNRAARIMDQLCDAGVVGEEQGTKPREVLMTMEEFEQYIENYV